MSAAGSASLLSTIGKGLREVGKNWATISFPLVLVGSIYFDWNHTRTYKANKAASLALLDEAGDNKQTE